MVACVIIALAQRIKLKQHSTMRQLMTQPASQVALGSRTEEICIGLDTQMDLEARHGYGLPDVCCSSYYMSNGIFEVT